MPILQTQGKPSCHKPASLFPTSPLANLCSTSKVCAHAIRFAPERPSKVATLRSHSFEAATNSPPACRGAPKRRPAGGHPNPPAQHVRDLPSGANTDKQDPASVIPQSRWMKREKERSSRTQDRSIRSLQTQEACACMIFAQYVRRAVWRCCNRRRSDLRFLDSLEFDSSHIKKGAAADIPRTQPIAVYLNQGKGDGAGAISEAAGHACRKQIPERRPRHLGFIGPW